MRSTFVGAGAIGGVSGMNADGLRIEGIAATSSCRPATYLCPDAGPARDCRPRRRGRADRDATRQIAPVLAADGCIVSLQDGLNEETIAAIVGPSRTVGAEINWSADCLEPGRILHGCQGSFTIGEPTGG